MNPLFHPVTTFFASNIVLTLTTAYTSRGSKLRYAALAFLALPAYAIPISLASYAQATGWAGRVPAGATNWNIVTFFDRLIWRAWDYNHYGPATEIENNKSDPKQTRKSESTTATTQYQGSRMDFASEVTGNARGVGLFWQVKNVPYFSNIRPDFVPSRLGFILMQVGTVVACYYSHNTIAHAVLSVNEKYLDGTRIPFLTRLSEVSFPELKARIIVSVGYWIVQYNMIQFFYSVFGIIGVIANPSTMESWRPLFGSPSDAYTIRNFWGKSWHQNLRSGCEGLSSFVAHDILQLPGRGLLQRYTKIFCSFLISGLMHARSDAGGGVFMRESGAIQFFCMQALGIMIEDAVKDVYVRYFADSSKAKLTPITRTIGYAWVLFFLVWTTPVWVFPCILNMRTEDALLSWTAIKPIFVGR